MKKGKSILTRCLALVLALVLIASSANLSAALKVSANSETVVTAGELVAKNYELADWEEALLGSGLLGESFSYTVPTADDELVAINSDSKKITAKSFGAWVPASADIMVDNQSVETVTITAGEGTYNYAGDAFSVSVKYVLNYEISAIEQQKLLNAGASLNKGLENVATAYDADTSLELVEDAVDTLASMCGQSIFGVSFGQDYVDAVTALKAQMTANNGILNLRKLNAGYAQGSAFMLANAAAYKAEVASTYTYLAAIANDPLTKSASVDNYLKINDDYDGTNNATKWASFKGILNTLVAKLEPVAKDEWAVLNLKVGTNYAALDTLLANVGTASTVNFKTSLNAAETTIHATKNMKMVSVFVELKVVEDKVGSTALVSGGNTARVFLTLPEGATADAVKAAIEASGVVAQAQTAWGEAFSAEHFEATATELPEKLNDDVIHTITYAPKTYTVGYDYQAAQQLPYGAQFQLPVHGNAAEFAYDYIVDGEAYMQGEVVTVAGNITKITRTEGKAYQTTTLYSVIGESMGDWNHYEILSSGALKGDQVIYYRTPAAPEMTLSEKVLTVQSSVASDYAGLSWVPYSYSNDNDGTKYFGGTNVVNGYNARQAQVVYALRLTNVDPAKAAAMLELARTIDAEEEKQTAGMEYLLSKYDDIGTLNKSYLDALLGTINGFDFTPGDGENGYNNYDDAKNLEMRAYFAGIVNALLNTKANYIDRSNNNLMLHTMLTEYKNGGLAYYYKNSAEIYQQVSDLAGYLTDLVGDAEKEAALALLLAEMGKGEFVEKISNLGKAMTDTKANLLPTNEMIDLHGDLDALVAAVTDDGISGNPNATDVPTIFSNSFTVVDDSAVALIAKIYVDGKETDTVSVTYDRWAKLDASMIASLQALIDAKVNGLGEKLPYYTVSGAAAELNGKIGTEMTENLTVSVNCNAKQYTVKIDGQADQTITINNLTINLPQHENHPNTVYEYTINGEVTRKTSHQFTAEDLNSLFVNGSYTISCETLEVGQQMLQSALDKLNANSAGNTYEIVNGTLVANVAGTADGMMAFATGLLDTGYGYIGINGKPMMYGVEGEGLEISIQALIDAICQDKDFSRDAVIALGNNGQGKILSAELQLGIDSEVLYEEAMPFVLNLTSVPAKMATVAKGLEAGKNNFNFYSNGDHVYVYVDLPEKVYEIYLTAMLGVSDVSRADINAINNEIALMFLYDYVMLIAETDVTAQTFENTLKIFDEAANEALGKDIPDYDISAYDKYLQIVKKALNSEGVVVEADEETMSLSVTGQGKHLLTLAEGLGIDLSAYSVELGMIKEFKDGNVLSGKVIATLANTAVDFEALVIDASAAKQGVLHIRDTVNNRNDAVQEAIDLIKGYGLANGIDYTSDLPTRVSELNGRSIIMLLDDIDGDLVFPAGTIIDLNGMTINGSIHGNGHVYIIDSTMDTANAGKVTGSVTGNVVIIAGNYNADVSAYLPDGYLQVNGTVRNALYTIESPNSGDMIVTINGDVYMNEAVNGYLPSIRATAADLVIDQIFNYYLTAMLSLDGNTVFDIDFDDFVGMIKSDTTKADAFNEVLCMFDAKGTSAAVNAISADLLDFAAIEQALINGTEIAGYDVTVAPYGIAIKHIADGDYLTLNIGSLESHARTFHVGVKLEGDVNTARLTKVVGELADIVVAENTYAMIDLEQPYYENKTLWLEGSAKASLDLDLSQNPDYQIIIAVVLAYGNPDKAEALINAIGDQDALKEVFNTITVEEVFNALKALEREVGFAAMAESLGVDEEIENAAAKERVVHLALSAAGYILEKLDITGYPEKNMGMIEEGDTGRYTLSRSADGFGDITRRGYTVDASAVIEHVTLSVKIFADDCLWGDANHDGVVDAMDATLVLQYHVDSLAEGQFFCTKRTDVNGDGEIDAMDATLILQHFVGTITKFPVEE